MRRAVAAAALLAALAGCGGDELNYTEAPSDADGGNTAVEPTPQQLCLSSACRVKQVLLGLPSAENILFTPEGRLFVSGSNVFEITRDAGGWQARPLTPGGGNFTGLAQRGNVLYVASFDGNLYAATLDAQPQLRVIYPLGLSAPNGMTTGPDGEIYLVNGPLATGGLPDPKIVRLRFDANDPMKVVEQTTWLTIPLGFPNGLQRRGRTLYFTDSRVLPTALGLVRAVDIQASGAAGAVRDIGSVSNLPDDLGLVGDGFLVALYGGNAIALLDAGGRLLGQTDLGSFEGASSVRLGRPPLFSTDDVLVTEKGLLVPGLPSFGNRLSVYRRRGG